jgi:hypothetical protein
VRILVSVAGRVGISDSDVQDSRLAPPPEPVDRNVTAEFWGLLCAFSIVPSVAVPTSVDLGFVGDGGRSQRLGAEMVPLGCHIVVAEQHHARHGALEVLPLLLE